MKETVTTTHLRMGAREEFKSKYLDDSAVMVQEVEVPNPSINHSFFMEVGLPFRWYSRLGWIYGEWEEYVRAPENRTWVGSLSGSPFGYFELQNRAETTEIMFFGILRQFIGRGLGAHLLSCAIERAWGIEGTSNVYVHTCTQDHPAALGNYLARGFQVVKEETEVEEVPDADDPVWSTPAYYRSLMPPTPR